MVVRGGASSLTDDSAVLLRFIVILRLDVVVLVQLMSHAVKDRVPNIFRNGHHLKTPVFRFCDCPRCTALSLDRLMADGTDLADSRSSRSSLFDCPPPESQFADCHWDRRRRSFGLSPFDLTSIDWLRCR
jgi:hypothetical protein